MEENSIYTLAECVDEYLAQRQINKKKYYPSYLISAKYVWKQLFKNTIYAVNSEWKTLKKGTPYNYIDIPKGTVRLFSVSDVDECGKLVELFYDSEVNIITKPASTEKKCGCEACDCGGLCDDLNSLTYTTKVLFTISGVDYYEKKWVKVCPNGDIMEYSVVPTKKYNDFLGDPGDYMEDYMDDWLIGNPPFSNYTIEYLEFQKKICNLKVKECGCPENIQENIDLLNTHCGCYLSINSCCRKKDCDNFLGEINSKCKGTVKISECGNKIYYIPESPAKTLPEFLLVNSQTSGENCSEVVQVPDYAIEAMFAGIDFYSKRFNNSYSLTEKNEAKYYFRDSENKIIAFLNPLSLERLSKVRDAKILW